MNETRNNESQISTRGLDSEMEKKMEYTKAEIIQEEINNLNADYEKMQEEAKALCEVMRGLLKNGATPFDEEYEALMIKLSKLADLRDVNRFKVEDLKALV